MDTSSSLPRVSEKILQYLNKIDEASGRAKRMDFLRIAGNEAILKDWVEYLSVQPDQGGDSGGEVALCKDRFGSEAS